MTPTSGHPPVALLLPGQGSQYPRMAAGLYRTEPVFTDTVEEVFELLGPDAGPVRADWLAEVPSVPADHVTRAQILLFAVNYGLARLIMSWGVRPVALLGHSVGELVAAALSGVVELSEVVRLHWDRVNRLADAPPGGMLAVVATEDQVAGQLRDGVVIGAVNAPNQLILSGPASPLRRAAEALRRAGRIVRPVPATCGFHSPMLADLARESLPMLRRTRFAAPGIPLYSCYTGGRLGATEVADPDLWASHPVAPVRFWTALCRLLEDGDARLVEAGPGQMLSTVARRHPAVTRGRSRVFAASPPRASGPEADRAALARLAERLPVPRP
jgi:[acyl-carrier-protein] S-malonyltransferase